MSSRTREHLAILACLLSGCGPVACSHSRESSESPSSTTAMEANAPRTGAAPSATPAAAAPQSEVPAEPTMTFAWRPSRSTEREYAMDDPLDQHHIWFTRGIERGKAYPVVIGMHGQPQRGQAPRRYSFVRAVTDVSREMVDSGQVRPIILVTPVFRYEGRNWPDFDLATFLVEVRRHLSEAGVSARGVYVFGHSGAAGCGGHGLNDVEAIAPTAVGFFDTCVGSGFVRAVRNLEKSGVPTLILHSVETAGFYPRQPVEYEADFDFGNVYSTLGLRPHRCPPNVPEAPLRRLAYRCAENEGATTRAMVLDTGEGEQAHEAVIPVALRFFLRQYVDNPTPGR